MIVEHAVEVISAAATVRWDALWESRYVDLLDGLYSVAFIVAVAITALGSRVQPIGTPRRRLSWSADWILGGVLTSAVVSWLLTSGLSPRQGVRDLAARLYDWRVGWGWYAFAVLFWPAAYGIGMTIDALLGGNAPAYPYASPSAECSLRCCGSDCGEADWRNSAGAGSRCPAFKPATAH